MTMSFPGGSVVKTLPAIAGDGGSITDLGRSLGEGNGNPLQCSCLGNPMDRDAWWATVHRVARSHSHWQFVFCLFVCFCFFNMFINFTWRLITLQYCSGFAIHWHGSAMGVHVFPILKPPPTSLPNPSFWVFQMH